MSLFYDPLPCLNVEVVCGPSVLVVVHRRCKDHGEDLKLSQPVLEAKEEEWGEQVVVECGSMDEEERGVNKRCIQKYEQRWGEATG